MKLNQKLKYSLATLVMIKVGLIGGAKADQTHEDGEYWKDMVIQTILRKSLERESLEIRTVKGDEAAQRARKVAMNLVALSGKKVRVRIGRGINLPVSLATGEIVIPGQGMGIYTDNEIQFMIAHELAHIELEHGAAKIRLAAEDCPTFQEDPSSYVQLLGSCIEKNYNDKDEFFPVMKRLRWRQEYQADLWAVQFLLRHKLPIQYRTMLEKSGYANNEVGTDTHPPVRKRLEVIDNMIAIQP